MMKRWIVIAAALGLVTLQAAAAPAQTRVAELVFTPGDTLSLPGPGAIVGMTTAGADTVGILFDIPDSLSRSGDREVRLWVQGPDSLLLHDEDFSGVLDRALAWDGESFWSCGDAADGSSILYKIMPDTLGSLVVEEAFTAPGHRPVSLVWDGRYLWLTDRDSGRIDRFDPEAGEFTREVAAPAFSPYGLAWDGGAYWLTDSGTGRLYRLVGSRLRWNGTVDTMSFLHRGRDVLLFHDGVALWYMVAGTNVAVRVDFE